MGNAYERKLIFEDTIGWIGKSRKLKESVRDSKASSKVYWEDEYPYFEHALKWNTEIVVTKNRTFEAAKKLRFADPQDRIAVLNFANAFHPGGGVSQGAGAQEECLCRCSTLYPVLTDEALVKSFYAYHKRKGSSYASDALIYSEDITVCKSDESLPQRLPEKEWFQVDVITMAAPDLRTKDNRYFGLMNGGASMSDVQMYAYHLKRAVHMLHVAASKKVDILVLGAFGCGAFQNNPEIVAKAYKNALEMFPGVFKKVEFAVYCSSYDTQNYIAFKNEFE